MDLYSPKSKKADHFRRNTIRASKDIIVNRKGNIAGTTIIFEIKDEKKEKACSKPRGEKQSITIIDFLKLRFYERMKVFFESEGKDEYSGRITLADEP